MTESISYLMGREPNTWYAEGKMGLSYPEPMYALPYPPDDWEMLYQITMNEGFLVTENVAGLWPEETWARWELLADGLVPPERFGMRAALAVAETIWLDALSGTGFEIGDGTEFKEALGYEAAKRLRPDEWADASTGWEEFAKMGFKRGADLRVAAWVEGVPLELVLA